MTIEIDPTSTLAEITNSVRFHEAKSHEFQKSTVKYVKPRSTNIADFKVLPIGTIPKDITFQKAATAVPGGSKVIWKGAMVVQNTISQVAAYR